MSCAQHLLKFPQHLSITQLHFDRYSGMEECICCAMCLVPTSEKYPSTSIVHQSKTYFLCYDCNLFLRRCGAILEEICRYRASQPFLDSLDGYVRSLKLATRFSFGATDEANSKLYFKVQEKLTAWANYFSLLSVLVYRLDKAY